MKKIFNIFSLLLAVIVLLPSCSKEDLFGREEENGARGTASFKKMSVDVNTGENVITRADAPDVNTFTVEVTGTNGKTYYNGTLAEMPEILSLPVATGYTVTVHSPENPDAAWETPYYEGTQTFDIAENEVTYIDPVVCKLANVKVSIKFDAALLPYMEDDCKVTVVTGTGASLEFTKEETRSGFFKYAEANGEATLVATFTGTVDENYENNFRTYTQVAPGNHYIITYRLNGLDPDVPDQNGNITLGLVVNSEVTSENLTVNVDDEDQILDDNDRPTQGGEDPGPGTDPDPGEEHDAPTLTLFPESMSWTGNNTVPADNIVRVFVHSDHPDGITGFTVDIDSDTLTEEILSAPGIDLQKHLDLVNPGSLESALRDSLHFPVKDDVKGKTDLTLDISEFTPLLGIYGAGTHKFIVSVTDGYGTTTKTLTIITL